METKDAGGDAQVQDQAATTGTIPAEAETKAPEAEPATGGGEPDLNVNGQAAAPDPAFEAHLAAERAAYEKARAEIPPQTVKLRPEAGQKLLGLVVHDHQGTVLRCIRMEDWRSDQVTLGFGDCLVVHVLAGAGLEHFEFFEEKLRKANEPPKLVPVDPTAPMEGESGIGAAAAGV